MQITNELNHCLGRTIILIENLSRELFNYPLKSVGIDLQTERERLLN